VEKDLADLKVMVARIEERQIAIKEQFDRLPCAENTKRIWLFSGFGSAIAFLLGLIVK
jgi:hypothetical protein